jgi:hypothetical protein
LNGTATGLTKNAPNESDIIIPCSANRSQSCPLYIYLALSDHEHTSEWKVMTDEDNKENVMKEKGKKEK